MRYSPRNMPNTINQTCTVVESVGCWLVHSAWLVRSSGGLVQASYFVEHEVLPRIALSKLPKSQSPTHRNCYICPCSHGAKNLLMVVLGTARLCSADERLYNTRARLTDNLDSPLPLPLLNAFRSSALAGEVAEGHLCASRYVVRLPRTYSVEVYDARFGVVKFGDLEQIEEQDELGFVRPCAHKKGHCCSCTPSLSYFGAGVGHYPS